MTILGSLKQPKSLTKLAYDALLKSILVGNLKPGIVFNEKALALDLGISRTPVREALLELSIQGFVTFLPRKGVVINSYDSQDVNEVFEIRKAIEGTVAEKLALMDPAADLSGCRSFVDRQEKAIDQNDKQAFLEADRRFHLALCQLTENRRLESILENIRNMVELMSAQALHVDDRDKAVLKEHRQIVEAIENGRQQDARTAMIKHLQDSEKAVMDSFSEK
jgi:DNA-binding GntR family transcriptional regulator